MENKTKQLSHTTWSDFYDLPLLLKLQNRNNRLQVDILQERPEIICLCGSTRFKQAYIDWNAKLTIKGKIVLSVGLWGHHERIEPDEKTKNKLDQLHQRKIDLADSVFILDVGGYIGESTASEIRHAKDRGTPVTYLSKEYPDYVEPRDLMVCALEEAKHARDVAKSDLDLLRRNYDALIEERNNAPKDTRDLYRLAEIGRAWIEAVSKTHLFPPTR